LLSCLLIPAFCCAQKSATIAGNLYYENEHHAAKDVTVTLLNGEHGFVESQTTLEDGRFRFGALKRASYCVSIQVEGYEPLRLDVDVSMVSDTTLSLYLKPIAKMQERTLSKTVSSHELSMPEKAREHMEAGMMKLHQGIDASAAIGEFAQALEIAPKYYEAAYQMGMAQLTIGKHADAEMCFRKAIMLSGDQYAEADVGLGAVLLDGGKVSEADGTIRRGLQLNPNLWRGHYELGRALLKEGHLTDAQASAEQARSLAPSVSIVYRLLSNIHLQEKNYPALLVDLDTYLKLDPNSPAGIRAKQLREQVQAKVSAEQIAPAEPKR
jgi:tetratricopeptide (TPR) repeat protein